MNVNDCIQIIENRKKWCESWITKENVPKTRKKEFEQQIIVCGVILDSIKSQLRREKMMKQEDFK